MILAIDPGNVESGYVVVTDSLDRVYEKGKIENNELLRRINVLSRYYDTNHINVAIEMVASYGMAVGASVFDTCVWVGRFTQAVDQYMKVTPTYVYRKDEKMTLCHSMKAKDANIRQALIDRFGVVGTKKNPGFFYGFAKDMWAAFAVAVTYHDMYMDGDKR